MTQFEIGLIIKTTFNALLLKYWIALVNVPDALISIPRYLYSCIFSNKILLM